MTAILNVAILAVQMILGQLCYSVNVQNFEQRLVRNPVKIVLSYEKKTGILNLLAAKIRVNCLG